MGTKDDENVIEVLDLEKEPDQQPEQGELTHEQVEWQVRTAMANAEKCGGEVAALARRHLGPAIAALDKAKAELKAARAARAASWARVEAAAEKADALIAQIHDDMRRARSN